MLNILLNKAYNSMAICIFDFNKYVKLEEINIQYHDFGTTFLDTYATMANINIDNASIRINSFCSKRIFLMAQKYNLKGIRKQAVEAYNYTLTNIKHELLHLYLYRKYKNILINHGINKESGFYKDYNIIFILHALLLDIGIHKEAKNFNLYSKCKEFSKLYKNKYEYNLYEFISLLENLLLDSNRAIAFETYDTLVEAYNNRENFENIDKNEIESVMDHTEKIIDKLLSNLIEILKT